MCLVLTVLNDNPFDLADSLGCFAVDPPLTKRLDVVARQALRQLGWLAPGLIRESPVDQQ